MQKRGFTLLEILIVIVISVSVLAFALPAHKRAQDRNMYSAAVGILMDLGSAVQMLRADFISQGNNSSFPSSVQQVHRLYQVPSTSTSSYYYKGGHDALRNMSMTTALYALFSRGYLQDIPFESCTNNHLNCSYKGYNFYICPPAATSANCCGNNARVVACMTTASGVTRAAGNLYKGARFLLDGSIEQISN